MELKSKGSTFSGNLYELREEDQTTSQWESECHQTLWAKAISPYHSRFRKHQLELVSGWRQPCAMLSSDLLVSNMFGFGSQTLRTIQWFSDMDVFYGVVVFSFCSILVPIVTDLKLISYQPYFFLTIPRAHGWNIRSAQVCMQVPLIWCGAWSVSVLSLCVIRLRSIGGWVFSEAICAVPVWRRCSSMLIFLGRYCYRGNFILQENMLRCLQQENIDCGILNKQLILFFFGWVWRLL